MASNDNQTEQLVLLPPRRQILASEGHVTDWPFFVYNSKLVHPRVDVSGLNPEEARLKLADAYRREAKIRLRNPQTGRWSDSHCIVSSSVDFGYPGDLAQRIFYLLVELWSAQDRKNDPYVYVGRADICARLGITISGKSFANIERALQAMKAQIVVFRDAWMEKVPGEKNRRVAPGSRSVSLIADWKFEQETLSGKRLRFHDYARTVAQHDAARAPGAPPPPGIPWILFGKHIHESLRSGYIMPVDNEYARQLKPMARRLYYLLNKRMGHNKWQWEVRLSILAQRAPVDGDCPAAIERTIGTALDQLKSEIQIGQRHIRYLTDYVFSGAGEQRKVVVYFHGRTPLRGLVDRVRGSADTSTESESPGDDEYYEPEEECAG